MSVTPLARTTQIIPLTQIDGPELDARIDRDPERLEELARDILRRGLIEPIKVFAKGERFEVVDGQRRYLASKSAGLASIECFVYPTKALALEGIKYAANIFREDMSVADEAIMMRELFQVECGKDIERLAALVGKTIGYCSDRLNLVDGDELVFDALRKREIGIGVAQTLNEIPAADYRRYYLSLAVRDGWKKSMAVDAVTQWKKLYGDALPTPLPASTPSGPIIASTYDPHRCEVCGKNDPRFIPEHISVHTHCKLAVLDPMLEAYRGNGGPST